MRDGEGNRATTGAMKHDRPQHGEDEAKRVATGEDR